MMKKLSVTFPMESSEFVSRKKTKRVNPKVPLVKKGPVGRSEFRKANRNISFLANNSQKGHITQNFELLWPIFSSSIPFLEKSELEKYIAEVLVCHNGFIKSLGLKYGTKHYKDVVLYCKLLMEERPAEPVYRVSTGRKDGWPNCLGELRPLYRSVLDKGHPKPLRAAVMQLLLTLFNLNKVCGDFSEIDIENIKSGFAIPPDVLISFENWLKLRLGTQDIPSNLKSLKVNELVFGPANGPNRAPKMRTAFWEAQTLLDDPNLGPSFTKICELTDNIGFLDFMKHKAKGNGKIAVLRKITSIPDKGNKSRNVAICDFWTQSLLGPLEKVEIDQLSIRFGSKSAFLSHQDGFEKLKTIANKDWVSIDASEWTDNFPLSFQYIYLKLRYGLVFAKNWAKLVGRCDWHVGDSDLTIRYGKGQGMGTKGSFIIASITDHFVIEWAMEQHYNTVKPYMKVGDDLVIEDPDNIMVNFYPQIGVPVNINKSKMLTPRGHFLEFVSRNMWDMVEVSPISANLVYKTRRQHYLLIVLYEHLHRRMSSPPTFKALVDSLGLDKGEVGHIYQLIDIVQRMSGVLLLSNMPDEFSVTTERYKRILSRMLVDNAININNFVREAEFGVQGRVLKEYQILNYNMSHNESGFPWKAYLAKNMDLNQIRILQFVASDWNRNSREAFMKNIQRQSTISLSSIPGVQEEIPFDILLTSLKVKANMCKLKIVHSLEVEPLANHEIFVELLKEINHHLKAEYDGLKIPLYAPGKLLFKDNLYNLYWDSLNPGERAQVPVEIN